MSALSDLQGIVRYAAALPGFLLRPISASVARDRLIAQVAARESAFLRIMERGIFANPRSPYRRLLIHAGVAFADLPPLVKRSGVEGTLRALHASGAYITLDEFKGRRPIERPGLTLPVRPGDFDNPLLVKHYEGKSSGSRGPRTRVNIDLALLEHEAAHMRQYLDAFSLWDRPFGIWRAVPPVTSGVKSMLRLYKAGKPLERWFSHTRHTLADDGWKFALFTLLTVGGGRLLGCDLPWPRHVPGDEALSVARWLAAVKRRGPPAVLDTMVSSGMRICAAATAHQLDIAGTLFRFGGEPYTEAKARRVAAVGCRAVSFYSMVEMGLVGMPCAAPSDFDDLHLLSDKVAALLMPKTLGAQQVDELVYTTLLPSCPKLLLNVGSGDYGLLEQRSCGCTLGQLGFGQHLRRVRSYDKLTSEGVTFLGTEILRLIDEVLPSRFGGEPTDYQLAEEDEAGLPRVSIIASPRVGPINESQIIAEVMRALSEVPGGSIMTQHFAQGQTLRLVRREPHRTASAKILPLHIIRD